MVPILGLIIVIILFALFAVIIGLIFYIVILKIRMVRRRAVSTYMSSLGPVPSRPELIVRNLPTTQQAVFSDLAKAGLQGSPPPSPAQSATAFAMARRVATSPLYQHSTPDARGRLIDALSRVPPSVFYQTAMNLLLRGVVHSYDPKKGIIAVIRTEECPLLNPVPYALYKYFKMKRLEEGTENGMVQS